VVYDVKSHKIIFEAVLTEAFVW